MATNKIQDGRVLNLTVGSGKSSGDPVLVGNRLPGVATRDSDANNKSAVEILGVYDLSVKGVDDAGNVAVAIGDLLYYVAADTPVLSKKRTGTPYGIALEAITSGSTDTINVLLLGGVQAQLPTQGPAVIADPGDAGAIPVTASGVVALTSAGSETRTLAIPTFRGQRLLLYMTVDNGAIAITVASAINETGNTVITFDDPGETIELTAIDIGGTLAWRVTAVDGATPSTP